MAVVLFKQLWAQSFCRSVVHEWCMAKIPRPIRPTRLIQQQVPIVEGIDSVVQITHQLMGQFGGVPKHIRFIQKAIFDAALGDNELQLRVLTPHQI